MAYVNPILERWREGGVVYSGWVSSGEPLTANWLAAAGFDEVLADLQHGAVEVGHLPALFAAIEARGVAPAARVPANDPTVIGRVLDMGALSVMVPMVESRAEAEAAVAACRFAPAGRRSMGPLRPMTTFGTEDPAELSKVACVVQIETADGLANVDAIASTPGLDAMFIGPGDLSLSLGLYRRGSARTNGLARARGRDGRDPRRLPARRDRGRDHHAARLGCPPSDRAGIPPGGADVGPVAADRGRRA